MQNIKIVEVGLLRIKIYTTAALNAGSGFHMEKRSKMANKNKKTYECEIHQSIVHTIDVKAGSVLEAEQEAMTLFGELNGKISPSYAGKPRVVTARVKKCSSKS
jgi:uncharacterized protein YqfB (UPF0267 family)